MPKNILHTIEKNMVTFSKGRSSLPVFILEDYDKAAFMTASKQQDRAGGQVDCGAFLRRGSATTATQYRDPELCRR